MNRQIGLLELKGWRNATHDVICELREDQLALIFCKRPHLLSFLEIPLLDSAREILLR